MATKRNQPSERNREIVTLTSTLSSQGQTTIPKPIREALNLSERDGVRFILRGDNTVEIARAAPEPDTDPVVVEFLAFLERDMRENPQRLEPVTRETFASAWNLVEGVEVDLDALLDDEPDDDA